MANPSGVGPTKNWVWKFILRDSAGSWSLNRWNERIQNRVFGSDNSLIVNVDPF
jgi:hypothetical protein